MAVKPPGCYLDEPVSVPNLCKSARQELSACEKVVISGRAAKLISLRVLDSARAVSLERSRLILGIAEFVAITL
jgi:hypothetical protein